MIDFADPRLWIAAACAATLIAHAIASAVWGHLNNKENEHG